ncbi:NAD-dependent epimerase/dehydratase [Cupriavidus basilensis OR16]|uniref:NAD-dependent epimerase/dehydratase n=1 Tax=Cupriavidus basilensis OR16 TaxID=1127483 RepID=H1S377_9BURK|nr:SDR family oxidoreductase [Cupriavidus basilensis]EHP43085.1 NAD-dependent epimerase/dehydratase [Cupriavidus basilensis OR16]
MKILVTGASGLVGSALVARLLAEGHHVVALARQLDLLPRHPRLHRIAGDLSTWTTPGHWLAALRGVDAVVNAVGIFRESARQRFQALHVDMPLALILACERAGVRRLVQLSALGAAADGATAYWRSKGMADAALRASALDWVIVQPSLVYARSATLFRRLAALPLLPVPADAGHVQPIHIDDLVALLLQVAGTGDANAANAAGRRTVAAVGPVRLRFSDWLGALRGGMGLRPARVLRVPGWMAGLAAQWLARVPGSLVDADSLAMLRTDNSASPRAAATLAARRLRAPAAFATAAERLPALLFWYLLAARLAIAAVWLATALVCFADPAVGAALLREAGLPLSWRAPLVWLGAGLDLALGLLVLWRPTRAVWAMQMALVLGYTALITWLVPAWWAHPFGPVLKNLPMLAWFALFLQLDPAAGIAVRAAPIRQTKEQA